MYLPVYVGVNLVLVGFCQLQTGTRLHDPFSSGSVLEFELG